MHLLTIILLVVGGLPFFQFYPSDYMRDTRALSCSAKGGWVDILCMLHGSPTRGAMTLSVAGWARVMSTSVEETGAILKELDYIKVADFETVGNGDVTVRSRRMLGDAITREQTRLRVQKHRSNGACNADGNAKVTGKKLEARSQKLELEESLRSSSSAEPTGSASADVGGELPLGPVATNPETDPVAMIFPTNGKLKEWPLRNSKVLEYRGTFPGVNVDAQLRKALLWCRDNPKKRKTAGGMAKFLFSWFERTQNSHHAGGGAHGTSEFGQKF